MGILDFFSLKGKVAIVTGGYSHLGKAFSFALGEAGAKVIIAGRKEEKFKEVFASDNTYEFYKLDISSTENIKACFKDIYEKYGRIDVLVNNAVYVSGQFPETTTDCDLEYSFDGVMGSVYKCIREVMPYMQQQQFGNIINITSMYGIVVPDFKAYADKCKKNFNPPQYGAAKAGVIQLTKFFAEYLAPYNIRVNGISPGPFPSKEVQKDTEFINRLSQKNPLKRIGNPDDLKGTTVYLASDASKYVTGQNIQVDGGWTIW